jgi:hypothetical protein
LNRKRVIFTAVPWLQNKQVAVALYCFGDGSAKEADVER